MTQPAPAPQPAGSPMEAAPDAAPAAAPGTTAAGTAPAPAEEGQSEEPERVLGVGGAGDINDPDAIALVDPKTGEVVEQAPAESEETPDDQRDAAE